MNSNSRILFMRIAIAGLLTLALGCGSALAARLGEMTVVSLRGEPLQAEVAITDWMASEGQPGCGPKRRSNLLWVGAGKRCGRTCGWRPGLLGGPWSR